MTSTHVYTPAKTSKQSSSTMSFGAHRQMDIPASAIRAGASSMPSAWQTRCVPDQHGGFQHGAPANRVADIIAGPFRRVLTTKPRKIAFVGILCMMALTYVF